MSTLAKVGILYFPITAGKSHKGVLAQDYDISVTQLTGICVTLPLFEYKFYEILRLGIIGEERLLISGYFG